MSHKGNDNFIEFATDMIETMQEVRHEQKLANALNWFALQPLDTQSAVVRAGLRKLATRELAVDYLNTLVNRGDTEQLGRQVLAEIAEAAIIGMGDDYG